jgi:pimeloyl-ACP methyl ester carboxylesterase
MAQDIQRVKEPKSPLILKSRGSFFVGGKPVEQSFVQLGSQRPADRITVDQMFVEFMVPTGETKLPIVLVHGTGLSGNSFDTTPDRRMGWYEYFVRKQHLVYVVDQVGRARSGFNQAVFNDTAAGLKAAAEQPRISRMGDRYAAWGNFRFGPKDGVPFDDTQYPVEAIAELSRQGIPDLVASLSSPNPTISALSILSAQLDGAVLMGHSQAGAFPLDTALLKPDMVRAMVLIEPGSCSPETWTNEQIAVFAKIPLLVVYGDHLDSPTYLPAGTPGWQARFDGCERFIARVRKANGQADMLHPPRLGILGNSHMIMQDKNNLQIADLIMNWLDAHTSEKVHKHTSD